MLDIGRSCCCGVLGRDIGDVFANGSYPKAHACPGLQQGRPQTSEAPWSLPCQSLQPPPLSLVLASEKHQLGPESPMGSRRKAYPRIPALNIGMFNAGIQNWTRPIGMFKLGMFQARDKSMGRFPTSRLRPNGGHAPRLRLRGQGDRPLRALHHPHVELAGPGIWHGRRGGVRTYSRGRLDARNPPPPKKNVQEPKSKVISEQKPVGCGVLVGVSLLRAPLTSPKTGIGFPPRPNMEQSIAVGLKAMTMVFGTFICKWSFHLLVSAASLYEQSAQKGQNTVGLADAKT